MFDTYTQYQRGLAFDITDLPIGAYYVRVHVNPHMLDARDRHDEQRRGSADPAARQARSSAGGVPPWHGIDTENYCDSCG